MATALELLLNKWARRGDVEVTQIEGSDVLRFGKGGGGRVPPQATFVPYPVPMWVRKRIAQQKLRLAQDRKLRKY